MSRPRAWRFLRSGPCAPAFNMALDEAVLRSGPSVTTFRTYLWKPFAVSLGYFQAVAPETLERFRAEGYGVVRRSTGGGAIFHGDELTYSLVWDASETALPGDAVGAYEVVHGALRCALATLGLETEPRGESRLVSDTGDEDELWCFYRSSAFDLVTGGRKLVGSAQRRAGRAMLMHGSIPTGPNPKTPEAAHAGTPPEELEPLFADALARRTGVELVPGEPTEEERRTAEGLVRTRYGNDAWTERRGRP